MRSSLLVASLTWADPGSGTVRPGADPHPRRGNFSECSAIRSVSPLRTRRSPWSASIPIWRSIRETDATGHFDFAAIAPGRYLLKAPTSDAINPSTLTLAPAERSSVEAQLTVEEVAVLIRVCRECKPTDYKLNDTIRLEIRQPARCGHRDCPACRTGGRMGGLQRAALPYPTALSRSKLEGTVTIDGTISRDGSCQACRSSSRLTRD
jgi:hypothetical protein